VPLSTLVARRRPRFCTTSSFETIGVTGTATDSAVMTVGSMMFIDAKLWGRGYVRLNNEIPCVCVEINQICARCGKNLIH
jgi:hypothetical protein